MTTKIYGPTLPISQEIHAMKYRSKGEGFKEAMVRVADALKDNEEHYHKLKEILLDQRFLPAGRVQAAMGAPRAVTAYNCFVSGTIPDSMKGIMKRAEEAAETMRLGGGIGYDFSTLRPRGDHIASLDSRSSGPISFMGIFDALCKTIASAGHRRGAQMGVLRVDHPDIEEFIKAKTNLLEAETQKLAEFFVKKQISDPFTKEVIKDFFIESKLTQFNISVGVTDEFMDAVINDKMFNLRFEGRIYKTVRAKALWDEILRSTWDWAEPGVLFIDTINKKNNLWYAEAIAATNPCGEQPLPPYGACLLGSFNLAKYIFTDGEGIGKIRVFDYEALKQDIPSVVRAMDNVIDRTIYPLEAQRLEAQNKRRMGLGVTGVANAGEALGYPYGTPEFLKWLEEVMAMIRDECYKASVDLALEKGAFPLFRPGPYLESGFAKTLPEDIRRSIYNCGIRNSHLLSVAPTGTISLSADNVSSGIEPVFSHFYDRTIQTFEGPKVERVEDYGYRVFGVKGKTANELSVFDHVKVLNLASKYVDSACSKTCNVGDEVTWDQFKDVYMQAYLGGASGCTTFRASGKRYGILNAAASEDIAEEPVKEQDKEFIDEGGACYYDPSTGLRKCE